MAYPIKFAILLVASLPCLWIYFRYVWVLYLNYLGHVDLWDLSTKIYLAGLVMHMMVIVPPHKQGELVIFGQPTGIMIGNGAWVIPNVLHISITLINFALLCRVFDVEDQEEPVNFFDTISTQWNEMHFWVDTRESFHIIRSDATLFQVAMLRLATFIAHLVVGAIKVVLISVWQFFIIYREGAKYEVVSRLGFRVMLVAAMLAWYNNDPVLYVPTIEFQIPIPFTDKSFSV